MASNYGSVSGGDIFFASRLHAFDWNKSTPTDKLAALVQATEYIELFNYIGQKAAVQTAIDSLGECVDLSTEENQELLQDAELSQPLSFPRGTDTTVPVEIEQACYLIAKELLAGRVPEADLENLSVKSASYGGVRTTYERGSNVLNEHLSHLIPSAHAFLLIRPFFRERNTFDIKRTS